MSLRHVIDDIAHSYDLRMIMVDGYDDCIIGLAWRSSRNCVAYSYDLMIQQMISEGMEREDAQEYFNYNILPLSDEFGGPIFIDTFDG